MNALHFDGRLASAPIISNHGNTKVAKFTLIRNDYAGKDPASGERREREVSIQFTAFDGIGEAIAKNGVKGDQLIVTARVSNNNYTDSNDVERYGFNFTVEEFTFGAPGAAKREQLAQRQA